MRTLIHVSFFFFFTMSVYAQVDDPNKVYYQGRIVNQQGHPVVRAWIDVYDIPERSVTPFPTKHAGRITANGNGLFTFSRYKAIFDEIECSVAIVQAQGYATQRIHYHVMEEFPDVILSSNTASLEGWVLDSQGQPVEDAMVCAFLGKKLTEIGIPSLSCHTDAQGHFIIDDLSIDVRAEFYVAKEGYIDHFSFNTDKLAGKGQYAAGRRDIVFNLKEGSSPPRRVIRENSPQYFINKAFSSPLDQGENASSHLLPPKTEPKIKDIEGTCEDADGQPISNAKVYLLSDPNNIVLTDTVGHFTLTPRLEACKKNVWWKHERNIERYETNPSWTEIRLAERYGPSYQDPENDWMGIDAYLVAESADGSLSAIKQFYSHRDVQEIKSPIKLSLKPACRIGGMAVDHNGQPLGDVFVDVLMAEHNFDPDSVYSRTVTDKDGRFTVSALVMEKNYKIILTAEESVCHVKYFSAGKIQHTSDDVELLYAKSPGTVDMGVFSMDSTPYEVSGIVTDILGRPISRAKLTLNAPSQDIHNKKLWTQENGEFVFDGLMAGPADLWCHAGEDGYASFDTVAGTKGIRFIINDKILETNLGKTLVPSAAIEISFSDGKTGEAIIQPKAYVKVTQENGNAFNVNLNDEGKARFLIAPGKLTASLGGTALGYQAFTKVFVADLYQAYQFECLLKRTEAQEIIDQASVIIYPEIYSEATDTWNLRPRKESDDHGMLSVHVMDRQTEKPIVNAEVLVSFDKGDGRYLGKTDKTGNVVFAICVNGFDPRIASITAPGYLTSQPQQMVHADRRYPQKFTVKMEREPEEDVTFPEILSESDNTWQLQTQMASSGAYHLFEVSVVDDQTGMAVPEATLHLFFNDQKGRYVGIKNPKGRYVGITDQDGHAFFAVNPDVRKCVLTSVSAPRYVDRILNQTLQMRYTNERKETIDIEQELVTVNVNVLDIDGNPAPKVWVSHEYLKLYDKHLPVPRWERIFKGERKPTDENGQTKIAWLYERGPEPQIDHFVYCENQHKKQFAAQLVRAMPSEGITLQMVQPVQVEGRIVDAEGNAIPKQSFNFYYLVNGKTISGPNAKSREDGSYGPLLLTPGIEYEVHIGRDHLGTLNGETSIFPDGAEPFIQLPDCIFLVQLP